MLNKNQKEIRDKKVAEISDKINVKIEQRNRNLAQAQEVSDKLQAEIDEQEILKMALESLK
jgi:malate synthase